MKLERIKLVTTFLISILHQSVYGYKPFNPILGETFQCRVQHEDGSPLDIYVEQTSHHPPILNFYIKHELFTLDGYRTSKATGSGNSLTATISGSFNVNFNDGTHITFEYGRFVMGGMLVGTRTSNFEGNFVVTDHTNALQSIFTINPKVKTGLMGKIFGGKKKDNFPDYLKGFIAATHDITYDKKTDTYTVKDDAKLCEYEGEYTNSISFDGKVYWSLDDDQKQGTMYKMPFTLPSDCRLRSDILIYKKGKVEIAQLAKMTLEDLQRKDAKLRKQYQQ